MNRDFFIANRKNLLEKIADNSLMVMFAGDAPQRSADQKYHFTPNRNFYYLSGIEKEKVILAVSKIKGKVQETLFIEKSDPVMEKWIGKRITKEEAIEASGVQSIKYIDDFEGFFNSTILGNDIENLYLDMEKRGFDSLDTQAAVFAKDVVNKYPHIRIKNNYHMLAELRLIKSDAEVEKMQRAIDITGQGINTLMKNAKPAMKEYQLEAYFDFEIKTLGAKTRAFNTIAASGQNATVLHYEENNCNIEDNSLILFDLGAEYEHYCADISRTFPINGKFTERQKTIYNIVLKALEETIKIIKPGLPFSELNETTKKVLAEECKNIGLIKEDSELVKYYYHGVSHYLGLDTHDVGSRDTELKSGMVFTVEPGLYIEEEGIGIRIEDDVLVTEDGCINLSKDIIKTVEEIEEFMAK